MILLKFLLIVLFILALPAMFAGACSVVGKFLFALFKIFFELGKIAFVLLVVFIVLVLLNC